MTTPIYQDVINEIGTQTLARLGLNIFNLNSYGAYQASVTATNTTIKAHNQHKNNPQAFGFGFENLDTGQTNIMSSLNKTGEKTYTTDTLSSIKKTRDIIYSGKNIDNLNSKDRANFEFIKENYSDEIKNWKSDYDNFAKSNHDAVDVVTFDKNGYVVKTSQHKVIKNTDDLLKNSYLKNNDVFTVPFDDYKTHKENLEKIIDSNKTSPEKKQKATQALQMLNKNNVTNRLMAENPKTTAILTQVTVGTMHVVQTGVSDAIMSSLSVLANGIVFEIKDAFHSVNKLSIIERIKRLMNNVLAEFKNTFMRGASFSALDIVIDTLSQLFKTVFSQLKMLWKSLRNAAKSIYNAIYDFITGKITTKRALVTTIIKSLVSAVMVINTIALENVLHIHLSAMLSPVISAFLSPVLAIFIGALATVMMTKLIDNALNVMFDVFAGRRLSKERYEKIVNICQEYMPILTQETKEFEELINNTYRERSEILNQSFQDFEKAVEGKGSRDITDILIKINELYGVDLCFKTQKQFDDAMESDEAFVF